MVVDQRQHNKGDLARGEVGRENDGGKASVQRVRKVVDPIWLELVRGKRHHDGFIGEPGDGPAA